MKSVFSLILLTAFLASCKNEANRNDMSNRDYFYPVLKEDKFYVYRNVVNGLEEQIHRIYSIEDSKGKTYYR